LALLLVFFLFWFDKNIVVQNTKTKINLVTKVIKVCILIFVFLVVKKLLQPTISDSGPTLIPQNNGVSELSSKTNSLEWKKWKKGLPEKFLANGKSVFIDFTATWCITCQVNKVRVLENEDVKQLFLEKEVVLLRADWTKKSKEIEEELMRFGRLGVPLNVFLAPGKKAVVLSEWLTKQDVSNLMIGQD
jgi:thiol:disulfide interchange protein